MANLGGLTDEQLAEKIAKLTFSELKAPPEEGITPVKPAVEYEQEIEKSKLQPSNLDSNLKRFHFLCKDLPSPNIFIDFNFYFLISSCLARRIWFGHGERFRLYPNLYLIFVADPGLGKSMPARSAGRILNELVETRLKNGQFVEYKLLNLGPDAISFEKLVLRAAESTETIRLDNKSLYHHSSTTFCLGDEMTMLFCDNTKRVVSFLLKSYDCGDFEGDTIKHGEKIIRNICINFLGCCTPETMKDLLKTKILDTGFTGRGIFLYGDKKRDHPAWIEETEEQENEVKHLKNHLRKLAKIKPGGMSFDKDAEVWFNKWHSKHKNPTDQVHRRLKDYYSRKKEHLLKLAINNSFADDLNEERLVTVRDLEKAESLLMKAEPLMHLALTSGGLNPLSEISDEIKEYLRKHGATTKKKLMLKFWGSVDGEQLAKIFDHLITTGECQNYLVDGKEGLRIVL